MATNVRLHREWFQPSANVSKCQCGSTVQSRRAAGLDESTYIWGEYVIGKWRRVQGICQACFPTVISRLVAHADPCGCSFQLVARSGYRLPDWLTLNGSPLAQCLLPFSKAS